MDWGFVGGMLRDWGIALGITVVLFGAWRCVSGVAPPSSGEAPDFELQNLSDDTFRLSDQKGQVVVLNFWATWCGPCVAEIPQLIQFDEAHPDVTLWGISTDAERPLSYIKNFVKKRRIGYEILRDPTGVASRAYAVSSLPTTFVVDAEGHIQAVSIGSVDKAELERMVFEEGHEH